MSKNVLNLKILFNIYKRGLTLDPFSRSRAVAILIPFVSHIRESDVFLDYFVLRDV